jgi:hypothetical protein
MFVGAWSRKFFIVHEDSITCHEDHMKTRAIDQAIKLDGVVTIKEDDNCVFSVIRDGKEVLMLRTDDVSEKAAWTAAIKKAGSKSVEGAGASADVEEAANIVLQSALEVRSDSRAAKWYAVSPKSTGPAVFL